MLVVSPEQHRGVPAHLQPHVDVVDDTGTTVASTPLAKPPSDAAVASVSGNVVTWWTGDALLVFDASNLTQRYTIAAGETAVPLGPGVMMAGQLLVPVTGAIGVYDPVSGADLRYIPVERPPSSAPVVPAVSGSKVIEQRGDTLAVPAERRYSSTAKVGSGLPDFQCLTSACASSRYATAPLFLRPEITDDPEALASANRTVRGIGGASTGRS